MSPQNILVAVDGPVATLTINRPTRLNALNTETLGELLEAARALAADAAVRAVILTGAGDKAFIAGADIKEMCEKSVLEALAFSELGHHFCSTLEQMDKPVIAAVNGYALGGGCELVLACDFAYASDKAVIGQPEVNLGIIPGFGGTQRLARRIPLGMAREMIVTGRSLSAEEALRVGLVNAVYPLDQLREKVSEVARTISEKGPLAVGAAKRLLRTGPGIPLEPACELERQSFAALFASEDQKEGMRAFMEKRPPGFKGK
jgi:enoyl-CoA hydratase